MIGSDFLSLYNAGNFYLDGRMHDLYDFVAQYNFQKSVVGPVQYKFLHPYIYPPFAAVFFSLFAMGSYLPDLIIWWGFGLFLIYLTVLFLRLELVQFRVYSTLHLFLTCFLFFPTIAWFIHAQTTPISLFLYTIIFIMLRRQHDMIAE